jgi:hypothetical protein
MSRSEKKVSALAETYYTGIAALAKESGFDVTDGELEDALNLGDEQLDEEELASMAGGGRIIILDNDARI